MKEQRPAIVIASGDEDTLARLGAALGAYGQEILAAKDGAAATSLLESRHVRLLITDLQLPDMTGLELLARARTHDPLAVGLVVADSADTALQAMRDGAFDCLVAPYSKQTIEAAVLRGLEHHELKRALAAKTQETELLRKQLDDKAHLLQNVAHELKNPLTVIFGYSAFLLKEEGIGPEDMKRNIQSIHRNAERLGALLEELLESSRLSNNKIELRRASVSAAVLAKEAVDNVRFEADRRGITVACMGSLPELRVFADVKRTHQILANLLGNALKFTPQGGRVVLRVFKGEGFAVFCVSDTGCGVARADQPRLFDRFYQSEATRRSHKGLGLGLDISRALVELHGGKIWVESDPGYGAKFFFTLPIAVRPAPVDAQPAQSA
jgi:signal transduction histidine kinase